MMFEKQCKSMPGADLTKGSSSSTADDAFAQLSQVDAAKEVDEKQKERETEVLGAPETNITSTSDSPPLKRSKLDE